MERRHSDALRCHRRPVEKLIKNAENYFAVAFHLGALWMETYLKLGLIPLLVMSISIGLIAVFDLFSGLTFNPPNLLLTLNLVFIAGTNIAVALFSARSYVNQGSPNLLGIGSALLVSGLTAFSAGLISAFSVNANVTIFNIGILVAAALQVLAAYLTFSGAGEFIRARFSIRSLLLIAYFGAAAFVLILLGMTVDGLFPTFFTSGGPTVLRQIVLTVAIAFLWFACLIFVRLGLKLKSTVLYWYSLGLASVAFGLFGSLLVRQFGGVLSWVTYMGQYMGGLYFLAAALSLRGMSNQGISSSGAWSEVFSTDRTQIAKIFSKMMTGFAYCRIITNRKGIPVDYVYLDVNDAFERMTGKNRENVLGKRATFVFPDLKEDPGDLIGKYGHVALNMESAVFEDYWKDGDKWYSVSAYSPRRGYFISISEDVTERKKAEQALRVSEANYRLLLQYAPTAIFEIDYKGPRFKSVNDAMCQLSGYSREELLSMNPADLLDSESRERFLQRIKRGLAGEKISESVEYTAIVKDGGKLDIVLNIRPTYKDGRIDGALVVGYDITERKKTEEALEESERKFKTLAENAPDPIMRFDPNGRVMYLNPADVAITGLALKDFLGKTNEEVGMPEQLCKLWNGIFEKAKISKEVQTVEFDFNSTKGQRTFSLSLVPEFDEKGSLISYIGISRDVTERKNAENMLKDTTKKYSLLFDTTSDGVWIHNLKGEILEVNDAYCQMSGYTRAELIRMPVSRLEAVETPQEIATHISKVVGGGGHDRFESKHRRKDGSIFDVDITALFLEREGGQIAIFVRDITERKKAEEQIKEYSQNLQKLVEERTGQLKNAERLAAIGATAGMVGHDIRNPLQAIEAATFLAQHELKELSKESLQRKNLQDILDAIREQTMYMDKIMSDLQDFAGTPKPQMEEAEIRQLLTSSLQASRIPLNIEVLRVIEKNLPKVLVDKVYMQRTLINIITNALQAMPNGGTLTLRAIRHQNSVLLSIKDTGGGIPKENIPKIFTPLFTTKAKGQGIGLAVAKKLVEAQGGEITFQSRLSLGTTFTVKMQIAKEDE